MILGIKRYAIITRRYQCTGCNISYMGTDHKLISQLPEYVQHDLQPCKYPSLDTKCNHDLMQYT